MISNSLPAASVNALLLMGSCAQMIVAQSPGVILHRIHADPGQATTESESTN